MGTVSPHPSVYSTQRADSGRRNQCSGEILIHFHLKFPFKFSICGRQAGRRFEAAHIPLAKEEV